MGNPLMPGVTKRSHYLKTCSFLKKPTAESCRFVKVCVTSLLPPAIKGLSNQFRVY